MKAQVQKKNQLNQLNKLVKALIVLFFVFSLVSCGNSDEMKNNLAKVDSTYISKDDYSKELNYYIHFYSKKYGDDYLNEENKEGQSRYKKLENELLDSMVKDQVMLNDLEKNKYKLDNKEAENIKKDMGFDENSLKANVSALDVDESSFSDVLYNDSIRKAHYKMFLKNNKINDSDVLKYYEKNKELSKQFKYNALVFDDKLLADMTFEKINSSLDFKDLIDKKIQNFDIISSDFVYEDDNLLSKSKVKEKDKVSNVFENDGKYYILMINSFNEDKNDLLNKAKELYSRKEYENYLKKLIKKANIKVFI